MKTGRRPHVAVAIAALLASGSAVVLGAPSASAETSPCTDGTTPGLLSSVSCTTAGNYTLTVPAGTTDIDLEVVGGGGGAGYPARQHIGGNAAQVTGNLTLPVGTTYLYVIVGAGGGGNNNGIGYGGGGSGVLALDGNHNLLAKLAIAGAGGGGAYNGDGGNAGSAGTTESASFANPGLPATGAVGGAGGVGNYISGTAGGSNNPGAATLAAGGAGGSLPNSSVGGSGGGGYAGGGGGGGGTQGILNNYTAGGGGGSSLASAYLGGSAISVRSGTGGIQLPGLVAGDGAVGSATMTFNGAPVATKPGVPTDVTAVAGDGQATVSFTAPVNDGGSAITSYTVAADPGTASVTCDESPCTVTGLTNGTAYTFTVVATNDAGDSAESAPSTAVTPITKPGAPTDVTAQAGNAEATVSFTAPVNDGGSEITSYTVAADPGTATKTCAASPCTVTGLSNGTAYTFTVVATNAAGDSAESAPSTAVTPIAKPGAPTDVTAVAGDGEATVTFTAPADNGGSAISTYTVAADPGTASAACGESPCTVTGLTNGTAYTFTVVATNAAGDSAESAPSTAVTPRSETKPTPVTDWFRDPLTSQQRSKLAPVPANPERVRGKARETKALHRTYNGTLAIPAARARGHQLAAGQGVQLVGLFRPHSARLTQGGRQKLMVLAASLKDVRALTCEGYADYAGNDRREQKLSAKRAQAVCAVIKQKRPSVATKAVGYGQRRPAVVGGSVGQRDLNRRVALLIRR